MAGFGAFFHVGKHPKPLVYSSDDDGFVAGNLQQPCEHCGDTRAFSTEHRPWRCRGCGRPVPETIVAVAYGILRGKVKRG
jgi:hypothetical protein